MDTKEWNLQEVLASGISGMWTGTSSDGTGMIKVGMHVSPDGKEWKNTPYITTSFIMDRHVDVPEKLRHIPKPLSNKQKKKHGLRLLLNSKNKG